MITNFKYIMARTLPPSRQASMVTINLVCHRDPICEQATKNEDNSEKQRQILLQGHPWGPHGSKYIANDDLRGARVGWGCSMQLAQEGAFVCVPVRANGQVGTPSAHAQRILTTLGFFAGFSPK